MLPKFDLSRTRNIGTYFYYSAELSIYFGDGGECGMDSGRNSTAGR